MTNFDIESSEYYIMHQCVKKELSAKIVDLENQISELRVSCVGSAVQSILTQKQLYLLRLRHCFCRCGALQPRIISKIFDFVDASYIEHSDQCYACLLASCMCGDSNVWNCSCERKSS